MIYLLMGILTFCYFRKKFDTPVFVESKETTLYNLGMVSFMILFWPLFIVLELLNKIRGVK